MLLILAPERPQSAGSNPYICLADWKHILLLKNQGYGASNLSQRTSWVLPCKNDFFC